MKKEDTAACVIGHKGGNVNLYQKGELKPWRNFFLHISQPLSPHYEYIEKTVNKNIVRVHLLGKNARLCEIFSLLGVKMMNSFLMQNEWGKIFKIVQQLTNCTAEAVTNMFIILESFRYQIHKGWGRVCLSHCRTCSTFLHSFSLLKR
jgi:hypothetical protein